MENHEMNSLSSLIYHYRLFIVAHCLRPVSLHSFIERVPRLGTRYLCHKSFMVMKLLSHVMKLSLLSPRK
jgi:hypothetical protein